MSRFFPDPKQPLSTCSAENCTGCPLQTRLRCHFNGRDLARFLAAALPPFIVGGIGIARQNAWLLLPWIGMVITYFLFVEIRVMCSHCPHYAEPGSNSLQCWANYGAPKLWKYRPGPMTKGEKLVFYAGLILIGGYPLFFLLAGLQWLLLVLYIGSFAFAAHFLISQMCVQCMNFACPFNRVEPELRTLFFARNPDIEKAWKKSPPPH